MNVPAKSLLISGNLTAWWGLRAASLQAAWLAQTWDKKSSAYNLLGWEMLYVFHILPIQLAPR